MSWSPFARSRYQTRRPRWPGERNSLLSVRGSLAFACPALVGKAGDDRAVDAGSNVIMTFNPDAKLLMGLGKRPDPLEQLSLLPGGGQYSGANTPYSFHRETDVGWDAAGNIFVSDGY